MTAFEDYRALASARLDIKTEWNNAYQICDLKPALGVIHSDEIADYDLGSW
jgi:hypothetical protein